MLAPIPYLDLPGYLARTKVAPADVEYVESQYPGYIERKFARGSSWINARLQKRYVVPLGQAAPELSAVGTAPPAIVLSGRPVLGSLEIALEVLTPGALGTATFWWSLDGGTTFALGPELAATGTSPPVVTVAGLAELDAPSDLELAITTAGALGTARFAWSADGGSTWNVAAPMAATGTSPPGVSLAGTSTVADPADVQIEVTTPGTLGVALFQWSQDGGATWTTGLQTSATPVPLGLTGLSAVFPLGLYAADNAYEGQGIVTAASYVLGDTGLTLGFAAGAYSADDTYEGQGIVTATTVVLGLTGLTATFPAGSYGADNAYAAPPPVPEVALGWLVALVDVDVWDRRGANAQDPSIARAVAERDAALAEIKEAADSEKGLFELPPNDTSGGTAVVRATPLSYSEASPFVSADRMERQALAEDMRGEGTATDPTAPSTPWPTGGGPPRGFPVGG